MLIKTIELSIPVFKLNTVKSSPLESTYTSVWAFLLTQTIKNSPAMLETRVQSLDQEDPLEKGMATHSSILAWRIPCTEKPGGLQSMGWQRVGHNRATKHKFSQLSAVIICFFKYVHAFRATSY